MKLVQILGSVAMCGIASPALAEVFIVSTQHPGTHWAVTEGVVPYMECVKEATDGNIDYNLFPSGQIASADAALTALDSNLAQIVYVVSPSLTSELPLTNIAQLPNMGDTPTEMVSAFRKVVAEGGPIAEELKRNKLVPLMLNPFPPTQIGMRDASATTLKALAGKKISQGGGSQAAAVQAMDGIPVRHAASDIYMSVQQGTSDGYTLSFASVVVYSLEELTGSISRNANLGSTMAFLAMNEARFAAMPDETQKALLDCGVEAETKVAGYAEDLIQGLEDEFISKGVTVFDFSDEGLGQLNENLEQANLEFAKRLDELGLEGTKAYSQHVVSLGR